MVEKQKKIGTIYKDQILNEIRQRIESLRVNYALSDDELYLKILGDDQIMIPISIFCKELSTLEVVVLFLHQHKKIGFTDIGVLLNRSPKTIWQAHNNAAKKQVAPLRVEPSKYDIPISRFKNRDFSNLEAVVYYLKTRFDLKFSEIGEMVHRNQRTIWTIYSRAKKKLE